MDFRSLSARQTRVSRAHGWHGGRWLALVVLALAVLMGFVATGGKT
jgi:hypothetical protein